MVHSFSLMVLYTAKLTVISKPLKRKPFIPTYSSFVRILRCPWVDKALEKSINSAPETGPLSKATKLQQFQLSVVFDSQ